MNSSQKKLHIWEENIESGLDRRATCAQSNLGMYPYIIIFGIVWAAAFWETLSRNTLPFYFAFISAFLFTSLRYYTGYDWPVYESIFNGVSPIFQAEYEELLGVSVEYSKELGFVVLTSILKQLSNDFQIVIFFSALILYVGLYLFLQTFSMQRACVFAVTFSWLVFSLHFSVLRQSIAVGFILMAASCMFNKKVTLMLLFSLVAMLVHISSILYIALICFSFIRLTRLSVMLMWLGALACSILFKYFVDYVLLVFFFLPDAIITKLEYYLLGKGSTLDLIEIIYVYAYTFTVGLWLIYTNNYFYRHNRYLQVLYNFAVLFMVLQCCFLEVPVFRNRLLYIGFLVNFLVFFFWLNKQLLLTRVCVTATLFVAISAYYGMFLVKGSSTPFIPYQSYLQAKISGYEGDARERMEDYKTR